MPEIEVVTLSKMELKNIRANLPKDWKDILAAKFCIAPGSVKNVLSGVTRNHELLMYAIEMAEKNKAEVILALSNAKQRAQAL